MLLIKRKFTKNIFNNQHKSFKKVYLTYYRSIMNLKCVFIYIVSHDPIVVFNELSFHKKLLVYLL